MSLFNLSRPAVRTISTVPEITALISQAVPVAIGVSGGKDSCAAAVATIEYLNTQGHKGERILIHSHLGRVEWKDSLPTCKRLAKTLDMELVVVRRETGDMMDRWLSRWKSNLERYSSLECVKLILPWSTPSMRFCTSELKTVIISRYLVNRFPGQTILSVSGIRAQESSKRAKEPVFKQQPLLTKSAPRNGSYGRTQGYNWHSIISWSTEDVFSYLASKRFTLHEAYTDFNMSRVSCAFCIMSSKEDLINATTCDDNHSIYQEMVQLEIDSTFSFQSNIWLGDVASHLLEESTIEALKEAKEKARIREEAEELIPTHLLYHKGYPISIPTAKEAKLLSYVRTVVARTIGLDIKYINEDEIVQRYQELIALRCLKDKTKVDSTYIEPAHVQPEQLSFCLE
jgi:3'-phosphoadenosine 5'-phosphosulfate sulfotransferase (PAPS reductase)/FAD synthetase